MYSSILFVALFFIFFVNASTFEKRDVTAPSQTCITDLNAISSQITVVINTIDAYSTAQGYIGALAIQSQESIFETKIGTATTDCCSITGPVSEEDAEAIIVDVDLLTTQIENILADIITKKPIFDSVSLVTPLIKGDIPNLQNKLISLYACLVEITPSSLKEIMQGYADRISEIFTAAVAAYA